MCTLGSPFGRILADFSRLVASAFDSRYGLQQGLSHDFSPSLPYRLGAEISVQSAAWRGAIPGTRDHQAGLRRVGGDQRQGVLSRDHAHMFVAIPPHVSVRDFVRRRSEAHTYELQS